MSAEIFGFYVSAYHRGEGVGAGLLERVLSLIQQNKGVIKVKLSVNPRERAAVSLYKKEGFVVTGRARKELKIGHRFYDMLFMEKLF